MNVVDAETDLSCEHSKLSVKPEHFQAAASMKVIHSSIGSFYRRHHPLRGLPEIHLYISMFVQRTLNIHLCPYNSCLINDFLSI